MTSSPPPTDIEKLVEVEALIVDFSYARNDPVLKEHKTWRALKAIAADIRGRQSDRISETQIEIQKAIDAAAMSTTGLGYEINHLRNIAEIVIGRWAVVRQSLQWFGNRQGERKC